MPMLCAPKTSIMATDVFKTLQDGWYNGLVSGLGLDDGTFQVVQPNPPIVAQSGNTVLWSYFNNIPPFSLTQHYTASGGNQFYSDYRALMSALEPSSNVNPEKVIGKATYKKWVSYVTSLATPPPITSYPTLFRNWALLNDPGKANAGASAYAQVLLDPILSAQTVLLLSYSDAAGNPKNPDWSLDYSDLTTQLKSAPTQAFNFDSSSANSNVSKSWTSGGNSGFFGLWGGSSSSSSVSKQFASSKVTVSASMAHVLQFSASPGNWYSSGAMGLAFANKKGNPWSSSSSINWDNTFGSNGNMQRFAANLIAVAGMKIKVVSEASYSTSEQTEIHNNSHAGLWPFYSSGGGSSSSNSVSFNQSGQMVVVINTSPTVPTVIGMNVLSAGEYLGHSSEAATISAKALSLVAH